MARNNSWYIDLAKKEVGKKYGMLTIIEVAGVGKNRMYLYNAICDCGNKGQYYISKLRSGHTSSCGCLHKKLLSERSQTHGLCTHPLYKTWASMKTRCNNPNADNFKWYGAIGISVCDEWMKDFKSFYDWAINAGWKKGLQIDRYPNKAGNYEPNNCRIVTRITNMNNTRNNNVWEDEGEKLTTRQVAEKYNLNISQLNSRIQEGWDIQRAIHTPFRNTSLSLP